MAAAFTTFLRHAATPTSPHTLSSLPQQASLIPRPPATTPKRGHGQVLSLDHRQLPLSEAMGKSCTFQKSKNDHEVGSSWPKPKCKPKYLMDVAWSLHRTRTSAWWDEVRFSTGCSLSSCQVLVSSFPQDGCAQCEVIRHRRLLLLARRPRVQHQHILVGHLCAMGMGPSSLCELPWRRGFKYDAEDQQ
jgi:hypothetical protein